VVLISALHLLDQSSTEAIWLMAAALGVTLLSVFTAYRGLMTYVQDERVRQASAAEKALRDGAHLAVTTLRHHIGNKLAVTVGYGELLADDPRLPPDAQEQALKAAKSAKAAAEAMHRFSERPVTVELDTTTAGPPILDANAWAGSRR
jgi:hypothetical protein